MPTVSIGRVKALALRLKKSEGIPHHTALERAAQFAGFANYHALQSVTGKRKCHSFVFHNNYGTLVAWSYSISGLHKVLESEPVDEPELQIEGPTFCSLAEIVEAMETWGERADEELQIAQKYGSVQIFYVTIGGFYYYPPKPKKSKIEVLVEHWSLITPAYYFDSEDDLAEKIREFLRLGHCHAEIDRFNRNEPFPASLVDKVTSGGDVAHVRAPDLDDDYETEHERSLRSFILTKNIMVRDGYVEWKVPKREHRLEY